MSEHLHWLIGWVADALAGDARGSVFAVESPTFSGKTHALVALHHLFGERRFDDLPPAMLEATGMDQPPRARQAMLMATASMIVDTNVTQDLEAAQGLLWERMAWELRGDGGMCLIAAADGDDRAPRLNPLVKLLDSSAPALVLVDDWFAQCQSAPTRGGSSPTAFEQDIHFAQRLIEAIHRTSRTALVVTLSSSIKPRDTDEEELLTTLRQIFTPFVIQWSGDEGIRCLGR